MILLGLNCGCGNVDIAGLKTGNLQGTGSFFPVQKPESADVRPCGLRLTALAAIKSDSEYVFTTNRGNPWIPKGNGCPISSRFAKLFKDLNLYKKGRGFNSFRHVCQTVGEESGDYAAADFITGHIPKSNDMALFTVST